MSARCFTRWTAGLNSSYFENLHTLQKVSTHAIAEKVYTGSPASLTQLDARRSAVTLFTICVGESKGATVSLHAATRSSATWWRCDHGGFQQTGHLADERAGDGELSARS